MHWGVGERDKRGKINSLGPHLGAGGISTVLKYLTCSLGNGEALKVSKDSDTVRAVKENPFCRQWEGAD